RREGPGRSWTSPPYTAAGKTGTAQMAHNHRGYGARRYQSSFAGYCPADNPKYSIIVVVRNPRNGYYGASVAGPVFRELADMVYANDLDMHDDFEQMRFVGNTELPPSLKGSKSATLDVFNALGVKTMYASAEATPHVDTVKGIPFAD